MNGFGVGYKKLPKVPIMERKIVFVEGPLIVGAGPGGLATAACLKKNGIPSVILERANCIASLWKFKTYDRLHLHLPKEFCQLPHMPFPESYPTYPSKNQFNSYLEDYVEAFGLKPKFNETVMDAEFDDNSQVWRTLSVGKDEKGEFVETEYVSKYLVVATGENAEEVTPSFEGMDEFGQLFHSSQYRNGYMFKDKKVLVVGTGNSGMEIALDLANYDAKPTLAIRDASHIWPREMLGMSTFKVAVFLQKLFPIRVVDFLMFLLTYLYLGNISKLGIHRPRVGPLELKMRTGKTPVLDVGTLAKVREGKIKVIRGGITKLADHAVEFMDGTIENFDAIVLATGFRSNVPTWLKGIEFFSERTGYPLQQFSKDCWKGPDGLYTVGFSKRGLLGVYMDALKVADDIAGIS